MKKSPAINASSMADIAFLLLVFFLVTTTVVSDKGIAATLPVWEKDSEKLPVHPRNVVDVMLNGNNEIQFNGKLVSVSQLREECLAFMLNKEKRADRPADPRNIVMSLTTDRGAKYSTYLQVFNELKAANRLLRDAKCQELYGQSYDVGLLKNEQINAIRTYVPFFMSEKQTSYSGI